jgi:hypothetical protein
MRPLILALGVLTLTACRVERTWFTNIEVDRPGSYDDLWVATVADRLAEGHHAENCAGPEVVQVTEGLTVTEVEWDGWQGECWLLVDLSLAESAPDVSTFTVAFNFDLCSGNIGDDAVCESEGRNTRQERTVTVNAR